MAYDTARKAALLDRLPYTFQEFARNSGLTFDLVSGMISEGLLKTVAVGKSTRIPVSEHRRWAEAHVAEQEDTRADLVDKIEKGLDKRAGIDANGYVAFIRSDV
jgi:hypothetical protein